MWKISDKATVETVDEVTLVSNANFPDFIRSAALHLTIVHL